MTTPRPYVLVSRAAMTILTLALGACASAPARQALEQPSPIEAGQVSLRFDNQARSYVHVYLVGEKREWLLGRVEPGVTAMLRIPDEALAETDELVQLAVIPGGRMTLQAAHDSRARLSIAQPASRITSQRWRLVQGQLTPLWVRGRLAIAKPR
jgi:hypothetical protein